MSASERNTDRRELIGKTIIGATGGVVAASLFAGAAMAEESANLAFSRKAMHPPRAPAADSGYSPAILADGQRMLFISGQGPEDLSADMETQIRQTFDRIGILLESAGATFANVVILRSYWVHLLRDLEIYRKVRKDYLVKPYPASTAVGTPELAIPGLDLEIEAVAVL